MSNTDIVRLYYPCDGLRSALDVRYCRCSDRCRVSARFVMFSRLVSVSSEKVCVVVVLTGCGHTTELNHDLAT